RRRQPPTGELEEVVGDSRWAPIMAGIFGGMPSGFRAEWTGQAGTVPARTVVSACRCGGHVDALADPSRLGEQVGSPPFPQAVEPGGHDDVVDCPVLQC